MANSYVLNRMEHVEPGFLNGWEFQCDEKYCGDWFICEECRINNSKAALKSFCLWRRGGFAGTFESVDFTS